jgi:hypothetical protein
MRTSAAVVMAGGALAAFGQAAAGPSSPETSRVLSAEKGAAEPSLQVLREIDDMETGHRWLLVRDWSRPAGPARLLLMNRAASRYGLKEGKNPAARLASGPSKAPVIRTGDRLIVEEHTPVVEARLAAIALDPASMGASLKVRLEIGDRVVQVVALGPGRAVFAPQAGARP